MEKHTTLEVYCKFRWVRYMFITIAALNVTLLLTSAAGNSYWSSAPRWLQIILSLSDLSQENNPAVWYSSSLLFIAGMLAVLCFIVDWSDGSAKISRVLPLGWIFCSLIFFALSFDEIGSIHEQIGDFELMKDSGKVIVGGVSPGWALFDWSIWIFGGFIILFGALKLRKHPYSLLLFIIGVVCYLSNPVQENFEVSAHMAAADPLHWKRPVLFLLLEEGSEIFGSFAFIVALVAYLTQAAEKPVQKPQTALNPGVRLVLRKQLVSKFIFAFLTLIPIGYALSCVVFGQVRGNSQTGVPINWYPSMMFLVISFYLLYSAVAAKWNDTMEKTACLFLALLAISLSALIGSDLQHNIFKHPRASGLVIFLVMIQIASFYLLRKALAGILPGGSLVRTGIFASVAFVAVALLTSNRFADQQLFISAFSAIVTLAILSAVPAKPEVLPAQV